MSRGWRARVIVVSDGVVAGTREDRSGPALVEALSRAGGTVEEIRHSRDGIESVSEALRSCSADFDGLIVTTGGTGFGLRDLTPEATALVIEREAPGMAEAMRSVNPLGRLSRGRAGTIGSALVVNLPGSTNGAIECLDAVLDVVPHALELLAGDQPH